MSTSACRRIAAALSAVTLAACGGGDDDSPALNTLPAGVTHHGATTYSATSVATAPALPGAAADTQHLLTAGLG